MEGDLDLRLTGAGATGYVPPESPRLRQLADQLPTAVRLGRVAPPVPRQALKLRAFMPPAGAWAPPPKCDYAPKAAESIARMYLNDRYGDCVIAAKYHFLGVASGNDADSGGTLLVPDSTVLAMYNKLKAGPGDSGCIMSDVNDYFRAAGLPDKDGRPCKIDGYVSVDNADAAESKAGIFLFGALDMGFDLPEAWLSSDTWDVTNSRIVGGHNVLMVGYDDSYLYLSSWGRLYRMTWRAFQSNRYVGENYALLAPLWYGADKLAPSGFQVDALRTALGQLGGGQMPDPTPVVPPVVPPTPPPPPPPVAAGFSGTLTYSRGQLVSVQPSAAAAIPPQLLDLLRRNLRVALPVVLAGLVAGKPWEVILVEVVEAIAAQR